MKKIMSLLFFFSALISTELFSQSFFNKIDSNTGYFYLFVPKSWEDVSKYNNLCVDAFSYKVTDSSFMTVTSIDIYEIYKNTSEMKSVNRTQLSYQLYTKKDMDESLENWVFSYIKVLKNNHRDVKILEKKVSYVDHQPAIYLKITYSYGTETIIQEVYDVMYNGIDTKYTYFYNSKEKQLIPLFEKVIESIKY